MAERRGKELAVFSGGTARFYDAADGKELKAVPIKDTEYTRSWVAPAGDRVAAQSIVVGQPGSSSAHCRSTCASGPRTRASMPPAGRLAISDSRVPSATISPWLTMITREHDFSTSYR